MRPSSISSYRRTKAVGAFPTARTTGFLKSAAFSMQTAARVIPRAFASAATSGSAMKQCTWPPNRAREALLIPARAIWVSVTMSAPARMASMAFSTAPGENFRFSL